MEKKLDKIDEKLDLITDKLSDIDVTLVKQAGQLEHHIYRTDLAEKHIDYLEEQIRPIHSFVENAKGVLKLTVILGSIGTFVAAVIKSILFFK